MATWNKIFESRIVTPDEADRAIKSNQRIFLTGNCSVPQKILAALVDYAPNLENVEIDQALKSLPYYWPNESPAPVKITMPTGFPYGEIYGINASGQMVGIMWSSDQLGATEHAFIFDTQNGIRDLNSLIDPTSGWVLHFARDINHSGQIVGSGQLNGQKLAFVAGSMTGKQKDFDGDGKADILWRHTGTGQAIIWIMDGARLLRDGIAVTVGLSWEIADVADFDGDGKADILWRHTGTEFHPFDNPTGVRLLL